jgi:hypothetical protein
MRGIFHGGRNEGVPGVPLDWKKYMELSPRFLYSDCKKNDGHPGEEGTEIRVAMKVLVKDGVCEEKYWPYAPHQNDKPKPAPLPDAKKIQGDVIRQDFKPL